MKSISQIYFIEASIGEVWKALTDPNYIDAWGGGPSKMSAEKGFEFSLWDGEIWGKNIEVINHRKIVQEWTEGEWKEPSTVTFQLEKENGGTKIELTQTGHPQIEHNDLDKGWKDFYLIPLKKYLEDKK